MLGATGGLPASVVRTCTLIRALSASDGCSYENSITLRMQVNDTGRLRSRLGLVHRTEATALFLRSKVANPDSSGVGDGNT